MWKALVLNDYVESMQSELGISNSRRGDRRSPQIFEMYIQLEVLMLENYVYETLYLHVWSPGLCNIC